jgi:diguanylate cyclase (GGDEF)-like protein
MATTEDDEVLLQFLYQVPIGLLRTTLDGEITMINPMAAQQLMPLAPHGNLANLFDVLDAAAPALRQQVRTYQGNSGVIFESLRVAVDTGQRSPRQPLILDIRLLKLAGDALIASVSDVSLAVANEQQRLASQLHDVNRTDALTSMPNRTVVLERIGHALAAAHAQSSYQFAVLFINVDRFGHVNASLGSSAGDDVLRLMAGRLNSAVRISDSVGRANPSTHTAARLGGDEFVVVLEGLRRAEDAHTVAQRLVDSLAKPYGVAEHQIHVAVSIGVVLRSQAAEDAEAVLQDANTAMREAKRHGGARFSVFEPEMKERAMRRGSIEMELRQALDKDELFVVYQPIVELASGACCGAEALVRWRHPERGVVSPIEFIEIAEESGLIGRLGAQVLNSACQQFVRWQRQFGAKTLRLLSVNLSRAQLNADDLLAQVRNALGLSGMPADCLQLEVTESLAAQGADVQAKLHELKALGLTLALDDFGTGYSSLSSLQSLPVDVVKIDRSFVIQSESSAHHRVLIQATVQVARSLAMLTVAEGVETAGQAQVLTALGCDKVQGYFYARPLPAEDFAHWLETRLASGH